MFKFDEKLAVSAVSCALAFGLMSAPVGADETPGFNALDANQDGYVSDEEAKNTPELVERWLEIDTNRDNRLDESEFSALEAVQPEGGQMPEGIE
jgi:hypothetical protein